MDQDEQDPPYRPPLRSGPRSIGLGPALRVAALLATYAALVAVYLPGSINPDTIDMCNQAVHQIFTDWHSPAIAGLWSFGHLPVALIFVVTVGVTLVSVWLILVRWLRPWVAVAGTAFVMFFPATMGWMGHVGKDMWFAAAFFAGVAALCRADAETRAGLRRSLLVATVSCFWLAVAARKNAVLPVAGVLLVALPVPATFFGRLGRFEIVRRLLATTALVLLIMGTLSVFTSVVVRPTPLLPEQSTYLFDLTGIALAEQEMVFPDGTFAAGTTLEDLDQHFDVKNGDAFFFGAGTPVTPVLPNEQVAELRSAWLKTVLEHPDDYLRTRISYTWALLGISAPHPFTTVNDPTSDPATWGYDCPLPERTFPSFHQRVFDTLQRVESWNLFRGWVFVVALVAATSIAGLRTIAEARALLVGGLLSLAGVAVAGISATFRYSWFTALCAVIAAVLALHRHSAFARQTPTDPAADVDTTAPVASRQNLREG